jgi:hypothetical protein
LLILSQIKTAQTCGAPFKKNNQPRLLESESKKLNGLQSFLSKALNLLLTKAEKNRLLWSRRLNK